MSAGRNAQLLDEVREIRLMVAENKAMIRALVRSAERRTIEPPTPMSPQAPNEWNAEAVRLLRGLFALKRDAAKQGRRAAS